MRNLGMGGHHSAAMGKDEWLTPPELLARLGEFDLDPCAPFARPWPTAVHHLHANGLEREWWGRVWCNPPYGLEAAKWIERLASHGRGTALVFARTETAMWFDHIWPKASAILFLRGRLYFHHSDGTRAAANAGAPSALVAYGDEDGELLRTCGVAGAFVDCAVICPS